MEKARQKVKKTKRPKRKNGEAGNGRGVWRDEYIDQARVACGEMGATRRQLAALFNVSEQTIKLWQKTKPGFKEAVQEGRDEFDNAHVEDALRNRALGYDYWEVTEEMARDADYKTGQAKMVVTKRVKKQVAPDVGAISVWLFNRNPDRWKNPRHQVDLGEGKINLVVASVEKPKGAGQ